MWCPEVTARRKIKVVLEGESRDERMRVTHRRIEIEPIERRVVRDAEGEEAARKRGEVRVRWGSKVEKLRRCAGGRRRRDDQRAECGYNNNVINNNNNNVDRWWITNAILQAGIFIGKK